MKKVLALRIAAVVVASAVVALAAGCTGFGDEEAVSRCDQEKTARGGGSCFTESTYDECIAAFTDCGDDAVIADDACPITYACIDD